MSKTSKVGPEPSNPTCMCDWALECVHGSVCHSRKPNSLAKPLCFGPRTIDENVQTL